MRNSNEKNRTICTFPYNGKTYGIHERQNRLSDGTWSKRRFLYDGESGHWMGWANNKREGIRLLKGETNGTD